MIFAVFLTNPAPICVLDEVDAPLDDYNVERFCDLLEAMRKRADTRFVTITHNPITMARMDRLFGVTMAEKGVSQLVSVELLRRRSLRRPDRARRSSHREARLFYLNASEKPPEARPASAFGGEVRATSARPVPPHIDSPARLPRSQKRLPDACRSR